MKHGEPRVCNGSRFFLLCLAPLLARSTAFTFAALVSSFAMAQETERGKAETVNEAICRLIEKSAEIERLPPAFLTRLIWQESRFRPAIVSPKGAQGIAQFMPETAAERGLLNPFDPDTAIPAAAKLLADHMRRFGSFGLAAAAYNAGARRVEDFLAGGTLPSETQNYVVTITGESAEQWAMWKSAASGPPALPTEGCQTVVASLSKNTPPPDTVLGGVFAPWGVQVAGHFSRSRAMTSFGRVALRFKAVLGEGRPMIIATRLAGRGRRPFYRVRLPAETRAEATRLCERLREAGGPCIVLPS